MNKTYQRTFPNSVLSPTVITSARPRPLVMSVPIKAMLDCVVRGGETDGIDDGDAASDSGSMIPCSSVEQLQLLSN